MIYNNYPDDYIVINAKWVEWDNDEQRWFFMTEDAFEKAQSLSDYTKQVRKELCEEIREICKLNIRTYKIQSQDDCEKHKEVDAFNKAIFGVLEILDQIEQGEQHG